MNGMPGTKINEDFKPAVQFKTLYYLYFLALALVFLLPVCVPLLLFAPLSVIFGVMLYFLVPVLLFFIFVIYWIPKYYDTMTYKLTGSEMTWRRGVWFKKTGVVPYNRITNIDIAQGPVSRNLRIASLKIQTAGYSAPSATSSEIKIEGIEDFEGLREMIMGLVRGKKPVAVETYEEGSESDILNELVRIRKLLEKPRRK
jgi:membrane protein YdbS with pleckstrin-like domain